MAYEPPAPGNSGYAQIDDVGRADADGVDTGGAGISFVDLPAFLTEDEPAAAALNGAAAPDAQFRDGDRAPAGARFSNSAARQ